jgi:hypothetical protein
MKIALAQLRLLLAVILLITVGAVAGLAGQTPVAGVTADVATLSTSASHEAIGHLAPTNPDNHHASCEGCLDCVHSTGSGCCAASLSAGECSVLHDAPDAVRFMAGKAFLATGIDPEALLHPPQIFV